MAASLVGTIGTAVQGTAGNPVTTLAFGTGESRTKGNTLICFVGVTGTATLPATPAGWEVLVQNAGTSCSATVFGKAAAGSDAAPTIAGIASGIIAAQLAEYSGVQERKDQSGVAATTTTANITATFGGADAASAELMLIATADDRSNARAPNDTLTSNHITSVTQAGSNNGVSSTDHYSFAYGVTNSNSGADTAVLASSVTTNITGRVVAAVTIRLGVGTFPNTLTADASIKGTVSSSFTADAVIKKTWGGADSLFLRSIGTEASGNTNSLVVNTTGNTGDIWIVVAAWDGTPTPNAPPAGWTQVTNVDGTNVHDLVWMRVGDGSSTVTIGLTGTANIRAVAFAYGPSNNGAGTSGTAGQTSGTSTAPSTVGGGSVAFSTYREIRRITGFATRQGTPLTATGGAWGLPIYKSVASGVQFSVYDEGLATGGAATTIAGATWTLTSSDDWTVFRKFINNNNALGFTAEAWIAPKFTADARIVRTISSSFTADAVLKKTIIRAPTNWTPNANHPFNNHIRKTAYDGTTFVTVALAQTGFHTIATATDPEGVWTDRTPASSFDFRWVAFGNGVWVAVGADGSGNPNLYTATDPTATWTKNTNTTFLGGLFYTVAYGNGKWVAGSNGHIYTATDPTGAWTDNTSHPFGTSAIHAAEYGNGYWVASGLNSSNTTGQLAYATDPTLTWTAPAVFDASDNTSGSGLYSIHYANGYWVVGGYWVNDAKVMVATDPTGTWTNYNLPFPVSGTYKNGDAGVFSSNGHTWVASGGWDGGIGNQGHIALTGSNPTTGWVNATDDGNIAASLNLVRVFYANSYWIAVGDNSGGSTPGHMLTAREYIASAVIKATISPTFTADATIAAGATTVPGSFTSDADIFKAGIAGSFTANADLFKTISGSFTADAVSKRTQISSLTADAVIKRTQTGTFSADADIKRTGIAGSFTADALLLRPTSGSVVASADIKANIAGSFTAMADFIAPESGIFTGQAVIFRAGIAGSFTADAVLVRTTASSFTSDAVIKRTQIETLTSDAAVLRNLASSFSADAVLIKTLHYGSGQTPTIVQKATGSFSSSGATISFPSPVTAGNLLILAESSGDFFGTNGLDMTPDVGGSNRPFTTPWPVVHNRNVHPATMGWRTATGDEKNLHFVGTTATVQTEIWEVQDAAAASAFEVLSKDLQTTSVTKSLGGFTVPGELQLSIFTWDAATTDQSVGAGLSQDRQGQANSAGALMAHSTTGPTQQISGTSHPWAGEAIGIPSVRGFLWDGSGVAADAVIKAAIGVIFTADAVIFRTSSGTLTGDGVVRRTINGSVTADAAVTRNQSSNLTANADLLRATNGSIAADADIRATISGSIVGNSDILRTQAGSFSADAFVPGHLAADTVIKKTQTGTLTSNAFVPGHFSADADIRATLSASFTADAFVQGTGTFALGADAVIRRTGTGSLAADAAIQASGSGSLSGAAVLFSQRTAGYSADAVLLAATTRSFSAAAVLARAGAGSFSTAASIKATNSANFSANSVLKRQISGTFSADADIASSISGALTANAVKLKTATQAVTADAVVKASRTSGFSADAVLRSPRTGSLAANGVLKRTASGNFGASAVLRATTQAAISGDAYILSASVHTLTADAALLRTTSAVLRGDAVKKQTLQGQLLSDATLRLVHNDLLTAEAILQRSRTLAFSAAADITARNLGSLVADALLRRNNASTFAADAAIVVPFYSITASAVIQGLGATGSFTANARIRQRRVRGIGATLTLPTIGSTLSVHTISTSLTAGSISASISDPTISDTLDSPGIGGAL